MQGPYYQDEIYEEECKIIKNYIESLSVFDLNVIQTLWSDFSQTYYCASWMIVKDDLLLEFASKYLFGNKYGSAK